MESQYIGFTDFKVENYRSIKKLFISDFRQFNLIVGENNCGKSSLLEAIQFCMGMPNGIYPNQMNIIRKLMNNDILMAFHNLDYTKSIHFGVVRDNKQREVSISAIKIPDFPYISRDENQKNGSIINNYKLDITRFDGKKYTVSYSPEQHSQNPLYVPVANNEEFRNSDINIPSFYWTPDWSGYNYSNALSKLIINKEKYFVIQALQTIDKNVQDIQLGANGGVFVDIGLSSLLPIPLMGKGIEKILAIITTISTLRNGFFIIDEFENGLHHTSMKQLWTVLFELCRKRNIQLFATTHSYECIESFIGQAEDENALAIIRLEKDDVGNHSAIHITSETAKSAIEQRWELR